MTALTVDGYDITSAEWYNRPAGTNLLPAFYSTGSAGIKMTAVMDAAYPHALHIDQANGQDDTADFADCEPGCYAVGEVPARIEAMRGSYRARRRFEQRWPGVYVSRGSVTDVVNTLVNAGLTLVPLIVAEWDGDRTRAIEEVAGGSGPYPVVGRQYANMGAYDMNVWSASWIQNVAGGYPSTQVGWRWCHKCQGLFWGPGENISHCPAGGQHDGSVSSIYEITAVAP